MKNNQLLGRSRLLTGLLAVSAICLHFSLFGQVPTSRPAYSFLRWAEDWSALEKGIPGDSDSFDAIKYVPLGSSGEFWASFGGDFRVRGEDWSGFNFGSPVGVSHDDSFLLTRFRAHGDFHLPDKARIFAEVKGAYASDRNLPGGVRSIDEDEFELQQLFFDSEVELRGGDSMRLRVGRQQFAFGSQRLVSSLPWANSLRTWDGARLTHNVNDWNVDTFGAMFVPIDSSGLGEGDSDQLLYGIYAKRTGAHAGGGIELYALRNEFAGRSFNGTSGVDRRWTLGLRQWAPLGERMDYEYELSYQLGDIGNFDVNAWSLASKFGYKLSDDNSLKAWAGFDWASGDDEFGGDVGTFNQLYPLGHAYFGIADVIGRQNILDTSFGLAWKPQSKLTLNLAAHSFWSDSSNDAIYNPGGGVVRAGNVYSSSRIGWEADLSGRWQIGRHLAVDFGYAHFFPESAIEQSGPSEEIDFFYLGSVFTY
ncbi:alginate export family protein [Pelagicoccus sp. SDUM812002]|uniref:alginate export family protein n=1 Tax=Pelagicoccus sp. SDUM812002 TaxID=3041266 RepID=UPI00280D31B9|nr:alginate export family protein [Pelagicoccus sp. SDUM812002]MDQ8186496.1 alginate export family protein [Pelagicoccus sp. SDUM812002]